jgi:poly(hydroxyalkanoate) depolymerase family esterase
MQEMNEVARLTREGRLAEATALIQRLLRGGRPSTAATPGREPTPPRVIDVEPERTGTRPVSGPELRPDAAAPNAAGSGGLGLPRLPEALRGLLDKIRGGAEARPARPVSPRPAQARPAQARPAQARPARTPPPPVPDGAQFVSRSFTNEAGTRAYKLYIPSTYRGKPAPLLVMLHGCTQSPDDFAAGTRMNALAEEHGFLVAYPGQSSSANPQKCWNWFNPGDQRRGGGEPSLLAGITRQVMRDHAVDPRRVFIAGLSAGGAQATVMGLAYPDLYAAVGVHSGLACGVANDVPSALAAMKAGGGANFRPEKAAAAVAGDGRTIPAIVFHSDRDGTVHPRNAEQVAAQYGGGGGGLRSNAQRGQAAGGHPYTRTLHSDSRGRVVLEQWMVHGAGHAWSGGSPDGSYTDPRGPDASREMLRFFLDHPRPASR